MFITALFTHKLKVCFRIVSGIKSICKYFLCVSRTDSFSYNNSLDESNIWYYSIVKLQMNTYAPKQSFAFNK